MVEARDIMARAGLEACQRFYGNGYKHEAGPMEVYAVIVEAQCAALTAAGWTLAPPGSRVVPEGELDPATVERCANHLDVLAEAHHARAAYRTEGGKYHTLFTERGNGLSEGTDALRALAEAKP